VVDSGGIAPPLDSFLELGDESFVLLTTFRKTGVGVPTTVWIARDGDSLLVITPSESGKVKRLRNSGRVTLQASGRMGKVAEGAAVLPGTAVIVGDGPAHPELIALFRAKYGFEWTITMLIERIAARRQKPRVLVRITPA
jgi:PPOX class probable F420-dependent enzyme